MDSRTAISKVNRRGILLVYPIQNRPQPASLWSEFFPKTRMRWEWDDGADNRVASMWRLREKISKSGQVVYAKWYQNRATFLSRELFPYMISALGGHESGLSPTARSILRILEEDSPLSTKQLKKRAGLIGRDSERQYEKALKELWLPLFIVGYGEIEDGAFGSLAIGASSVLFDDLWAQAQTIDPVEADAVIEKKLGADSLFLKQCRKLKAKPTKRAFVVQKTEQKGFLRYEDLVKK